MMEKEAAKRPLPTAALYGLQNLQRLDNDLSVSERHRVSLLKQAVRATSAFRPIVERTSRHVRKVPCVDGSELARAFFTFCSIGRCSHVFGL